MAEEYIVDKAVCTCQFGSTSGFIRVIDQQFVYMNGKLTATSMTLGNALYPPGFTICRTNPMFPKPCIPAIVQWTDFYQGVGINGVSYPLKDSSKGTCAMGCPGCIKFANTGQIAIPGIVQLNEASAENLYELDAMGNSKALEKEEENFYVI